MKTSFYIGTFLFLLLLSCAGDLPTQSISNNSMDSLGLAFRITGISPMYGSPGDRIIVTGYGFSEKENDNHVFFEGGSSAQAHIDSCTKTKLYIKVPQKAKSGFISFETNNFQGKSPEIFRVITDTGNRAIQLISISPKILSYGDILTITTTDNEVAKELTTLTFSNGVTVMPYFKKNEVIYFNVPMGACSGQITLKLYNQLIIPAEYIEIREDFLYKFNKSHISIENIPLTQEEAFFKNNQFTGEIHSDTTSFFFEIENHTATNIMNGDIFRRTLLPSDSACACINTVSALGFNKGLALRNVIINKSINTSQFGGTVRTEQLFHINLDSNVQPTLHNDSLIYVIDLNPTNAWRITFEKVETKTAIDNNTVYSTKRTSSIISYDIHATVKIALFK